MKSNMIFQQLDYFLIPSYFRMPERRQPIPILKPSIDVGAF